MSADWKTESVGNVATLQRGFDLPSRLRKPGSVPIITSSGVEYGHHEAKVKGPGVVTGRYGTIGEVFFVQGDFWPLNTTLYVRDFHGNSPRFVSYLLRTIDFKTHSGKSGVPGVNRNDLHEIVVTLPLSLAEQEAIAEALSDADALIESLEQLLTKKHQTKKGVMQGLLTGKKRLPGFSGDWETTALGRAADIRNGATPSTQVTGFWNGSIPWCTPTDITGTPGKYLFTTKRKLTAEGLTSCAASLLPTGALLLCSRATIGEVKIAASPVCTNQGFKSLVCKDGVSNEFLYYRLVTLKPQMMERAIGSTFLEIGKRDLAAIEVMLPPCDEQTAIATTLSDMDAEITALEAKLSKARQIKQGMMQELLTGRIRLI